MILLTCFGSFFFKKYWLFFVLLVTFFCSAYTVHAGVVVTDVTDIGELPTTPNNGGVIGYDAGMSVHFGSFSYWFFGDTNRDSNRPNGNWQLDNVLELGMANGYAVAGNMELCRQCTYLRIYA